MVVAGVGIETVVLRRRSAGNQWPCILTCPPGWDDRPIFESQDSLAVARLGRAFCDLPENNETQDDADKDHGEPQHGRPGIACVLVIPTDLANLTLA